jgi:hypothetical protein
MECGIWNDPTLGIRGSKIRKLRTQNSKHRTTGPARLVRSPDQIGVEAVHRFDREGFDFVIDNRASCLPKA